jgi:unsaturated rhamnogalacturonyl hydrolase
MRLFTLIGLSAILTVSCAGEDSNAPRGGTGGTQAGAGGAATGGNGGASDTGGDVGTGGAAETGGSGDEDAATGGSGGDSNPEGGTQPEGGTPSDGGIINEPGPASKIGFDWGRAVIEGELGHTFGASYPEGLVLHGIYMAYKRLKEPKLLDVLTGAADGYGTASGGSLDSIMHVTASDDAYELMPSPKYKSAADGTRRIFDNYPKEDGVFWHAKGASRAHQLWGDGVFMSLSFLTRYSIVFNDPTVYPIAVTQIVNTHKHLHNPDTGLLYHAWDGSGVAEWANPPTNAATTHWGRAMGWFGMATIMTLEMLPANDPGRPEVEAILKGLVTAWAKYQDPATGRWFQVVDKGDNPENWTETSCSSMYSYVIWWAYKHRVVDASFAAVASKGLDGVLQKVTKDANNKTTIHDICQGLNASSDVVGNYYHHGRADNDNHGIGAFLLMWEGLQ